MTNYPFLSYDKKAITLLALLCMARPSDLAPMSTMFEPELGTTSRTALCTDQLVFNQDGSLTITFFGIKNDYNRKGFEVRIPRTEDAAIDPVGCLHTYIRRTTEQRPLNGPVFLTLRSPYHAIKNTTIGDILCDSIKAAGLQDQGYTPRSFRPTGATAAIQTQCDPGTARLVGRWKSESVFYDRYVYPVATDKFSDRVLSFKGLDNE